MNKWALLFAIGIFAIIFVYAFNSYFSQIQQDKDTQTGIYINKSITTKFQENFERQNALGNKTIDHLVQSTDEVKDLLKARTPVFVAIEHKQDDILGNLSIVQANQRTIINLLNESR